MLTAAIYIYTDRFSSNCSYHKNVNTISCSLLKESAKSDYFSRAKGLGVIPGKHRCLCSFSLKMGFQIQKQKAWKIPILKAIAGSQPFFSTG